MTGPARDDDSGDGPWRPSPVFLAAAAALVAIAVAAGIAMTGSAPSSPPTSTPVAEAPGASAPGPAGAWSASAPRPAASWARVSVAAADTGAGTAPAASAPRRIPRVRGVNEDPSPDLRDYINDGEVPTMAEVIQRLHDAGVHTGLGAFNPPGTRPPLVGLAVPEDFPLPEGYVRHYQATDDGQRIEPILMFAPDHVFYDAAGQPIAIPKDRVVPPEMAPSGLPIRRIVVPAPREPGR